MRLLKRDFPTEATWDYHKTAMLAKGYKPYDWEIDKVDFRLTVFYRKNLNPKMVVFYHLNDSIQVFQAISRNFSVLN